MLEIIVILALLNTTLLHCAKKWGVVDWFMIYVSDKVCYFCISFWMSVAETLFVYLVTNEPTLIIVPFCAATLTNFFINAALMHDNK